MPMVEDDAMMRCAFLSLTHAFQSLLATNEAERVVHLTTSILVVEEMPKAVGDATKTITHS